MANRFWDQVEKLDDSTQFRPGVVGGCWEWRGDIGEDGYGRISVHGRSRKAHIVSWWLEHGYWPTLFLCHMCDNRWCVRPSHIFEGTNQENLRDAGRKGRLGLHRRKLQEPQVEEILARLKKGEHPVIISADYGVSPATIWNLKLGRTFKHVTRP